MSDYYWHNGDYLPTRPMVPPREKPYTPPPEEVREVQLEYVADFLSEFIEFAESYVPDIVEEFCEKYPGQFKRWEQGGVTVCMGGRRREEAG